MVIFLELEYIFLDCERLPQLWKKFPWCEHPVEFPAESMGSLFPPGAAIFLEYSIRVFFVIAGHSLLKIGLPVWVLPCRVVEKCVSSPSQLFEVLKSLLRVILLFGKQDTFIPYN